MEASRQNIDPDVWSVFFWIPGTPLILWIVYAVFCIQIGLLIVGFKTRFQTICLFIWIVSLHHRNNLIWEGGDILLRLTLFLMMFMLLGILWSIDARQRRKKERRVLVWLLRLLQIQLSLLYFSSVGEKLRGQDWLDGSAVYYAAQLDDTFGRFFSMDLASEYFWVYQLLTWLTLAFEVLLIGGGMGAYFTTIYSCHRRPISLLPRTDDEPVCFPVAYDNLTSDLPFPCGRECACRQN